MTEVSKGVGAPAGRALAAAGVERLEDLTAWTEAGVAGLHGVGPKAVSVLRQALADAGMSFAGGRPGDVPEMGPGTGDADPHT